MPPYARHRHVASTEPCLTHSALRTPLTPPQTWDDIHVDVKGWSHVANSTFETFRESYPDVPQVLSECCSCNSQRAGYNGDRTLDPCIWEQNSPMQLPYVAGSLGVWTLFDYFGEPGIPNEDVGWPEVSSSFGQFDLAGFPKVCGWGVYCYDFLLLPSTFYYS